MEDEPVVPIPINKTLAIKPKIQDKPIDILILEATENYVHEVMPWMQFIKLTHVDYKEQRNNKGAPRPGYRYYKVEKAYTLRDR